MNEQSWKRRKPTTPTTAVGRGRGGFHPTASERLKRGQIGVERAYVVLNFCSNKTNVTTGEAGFQNFFGKSFYFSRKKGDFLGSPKGTLAKKKPPQRGRNNTHYNKQKNIARKTKTD